MMEIGNMKVIRRRFEFTKDYIVCINHRTMIGKHDGRIIFEETISDINRRDILLKEILDNIKEKVHLLGESEQYILNEFIVDVKVFGGGIWLRIFNNNLQEPDSFLLGEICEIPFSNKKDIKQKVEDMLSKLVLTDKETEQRINKEIGQLWRF